MTTCLPRNGVIVAPGRFPWQTTLNLGVDLFGAAVDVPGEAEVDAASYVYRLPLTVNPRRISLVSSGQWQPLRAA